jgi:hypothetical protein
VEIVRRIKRELFRHESVIGNFSGKYSAMIRERRAFSLQTQAFSPEIPANTRKNADGREMPGRPGSTGLAVFGREVLTDG